MDRTELLLRAKRIGGIALVLLLAIVVVSAYENKEAGEAEGQNIHIQPLENGHFLVDTADVQAIIKSSFGYLLTERPIKWLDVDRAERVLEADPFVEVADVFIDAKNWIHIEIQQREPLLRVIDNNGLNYYLDRQGNQMPLSAHFTAQVLVVTGSIPPYVEDFAEREGHLLNAIFDLGHLLSEDPLWNSMIEQVYVQDGQFKLIPKVGSQYIEFGPYTDVEDKLHRLEVFYQEGMPREGWNKYKSIDLRYEGQVVCVKR
ncbi:MAG: cell division protein FtsQ [Saprospiraceae bacterium]|nr:cell division protein FtsQ [Saprospiraceae bacterium]